MNIYKIVKSPKNKQTVRFDHTTEVYITYAIYQIQKSMIGNQLDFIFLLCRICTIYRALDFCEYW